jgi:hypothetical protein
VHVCWLDRLTLSGFCGADLRVEIRDSPLAPDPQARARVGFAGVELRYGLGAHTNFRVIFKGFAPAPSKVK